MSIQEEDTDFSTGSVDAKPLSHRAHIHSEESLRNIVNRLSRAEGHVRAIKDMVQASRSCPEVLTQIAAVRGSLDRAAQIILYEHLSQCLHQAAEEGDIEAEVAALKEVLARFLLTKVS